MIAEDLGVITPAVHRLRDALGLPGMAVLQFGFTPGDPRNTHDLPHHREHQVVYTGTHDNDTLRGWYESLGAEQRAMVDAARPGSRRSISCSRSSSSRRRSTSCATSSTTGPTGSASRPRASRG